LKNWIKQEESRIANMKSILILSAMLGCASGFTTERPNYTPIIVNLFDQRLPPCLRGKAFTPGFPRMLRTCVGSLIKSTEIRSYMDLDVCQFVKNSVAMGSSCVVNEISMETGCSEEVVEGLVGWGSDDIPIKFVEFIFCGGPDPFEPPRPNNVPE
ncbi:unnamed protein product, partial [Owenia fusiformis]